MSKIGNKDKKTYTFNSLAYGKRMKRSPSLPLNPYHETLCLVFARKLLLKTETEDFRINPKIWTQ